jgi:ParB-like chromosome segregation protein Spo0J
MTPHPIADLFPVMTDDELRELAEDIAARGLLQPIVLDDQDRVLDGRNRLAACELAGVEPRFETYKGDDPDGYALAVNVQRRMLTEVQRAQVIVDAVPDEVFNSNTRGLGSQLAAEHDARRSAVVKAMTIRRHLPERDRKAVRDGTAPGEATYRKALAVRDVEAEAPDLAGQLAAGDLSLDQARMALDQRRRERRETVARMADRVKALCRGFDQACNLQPAGPEHAYRAEVMEQLTDVEREILRRFDELTTAMED